MQMKKLRGGIGALTSHLCDVLESHGGEVRLRTKVTEILVADGRVTGVRTEAGRRCTPRSSFRASPRTPRSTT